MLFHQLVNVGGLELSGAPAHHQHVGDDAVGPVAVITDTLHGVVQVVGDFLNQPLLVVGNVVADFFQHFL